MMMVMMTVVWNCALLQQESRNLSVLEIAVYIWWRLEVRD
jgi:hypothetical protein